MTNLLICIAILLALLALLGCADLRRDLCLRTMPFQNCEATR